MPNVRRLSPSETAIAARWDAFVMSCPQATFFHRAGWQRVLREVFRHETHFLYAEVDGRIEGVVPTRPLEPNDIWLAIVLGHLTRCVLTVLRFRQGKWRTIQVVH